MVHLKQADQAEYIRPFMNGDIYVKQALKVKVTRVIIWYSITLLYLLNVTELHFFASRENIVIFNFKKVLVTCVCARARACVRARVRVRERECVSVCPCLIPLNDYRLKCVNIYNQVLLLKHKWYKH